MNGKKIAIIGTSSSIMRAGYSSHLQDLLPDCKIDNFSLGGASSIYEALMMDQLVSPEHCDYMIFDFFINVQ